MKTLRERVVYIRGMEEIANLDYEEPLAKMFFQVLELLEEVVEEIDDLRDRTEENEDFLEALDADLADVEDAVFEDEEGPCHCEDPEEFEIQCPHCDGIITIDEDELADVADTEMVICCPDCGEVLFTDDADLEEEHGAEVAETEENED